MYLSTLRLTVYNDLHWRNFAKCQMFRILSMALKFFFCRAPVFLTNWFSVDYPTYLLRTPVSPIVCWPTKFVIWYVSFRVCGRVSAFFNTKIARAKSKHYLLETSNDVSIRGIPAQKTLWIVLTDTTRSVQRAVFTAGQKMANGANNFFVFPSFILWSTPTLHTAHTY